MKKAGNWIDFNAGSIAQGADPYEFALKLMHLIVRVVSGEKSVSEKRGFNEIVIWKDGVTM